MDSERKTSFKELFSTSQKEVDKARVERERERERKQKRERGRESVCMCVKNRRFYVVFTF